MFYFQGTRKPNFKNIQKINYDEYWRKRGFELRSKLMAREKIFFNWIKPDSSVLDMGCGNSRLLYELKQQKKCRSFGLDISDLVIENLKKMGIEGKVNDIENHNFQLSENYDYIILSEVLEHLREPEELIGRIKKQTNYLLISIPNIAFYRYRIGLGLKGRFPAQWVFHPSEHLRYWSHLDFLDWLKAMNLKLIKSRSSNGFGFLKNIFKNLFGHQICYFVQTKNKSIV